MDVVAEVNEELIAEVLATATGIPVFKLTEEGIQRLLRMEDQLHRRVIGQNDAIKALSQAIRRTRASPRTRSAPADRSSSRVRQASARPNCPRRWPSSCSATRTR